MPALPEQGQIASVRQRRFVVSDVRTSALPSNPLYGFEGEPQHLVTLASIEDDALGETLQVIWEIEPGAQVTEKVALPEPIGFDPPAKFDAFLNAVRWGAVASADVSLLQAPFRSGIEIEDYQLDPLVRAVQMPRVNLLIADDVGMGKTVEAGLVIQELIVRGRARSVLVICPASLQFHWRDQMREKFGLEFRIVDAELMRHLRRSRGIHVNPWAHFPRLITSIDYLKRDRPLRLMKEVLPERPTYPRQFDILVIDEAHNVAPSGRGHYATDSQRTLAIREIAPHFEHKLFLTATPHNGYQESFSALLELLDNQRFARTVLPDRRQLEAVMVRRLKSEIEDWDGKPRFPQRRLEVIEVDYSQEEKQVHAWLKEYSQLRQAHASDDSEKFATEFVLKLLKKRLFSSPAAFAATLAKHEQTLAGRGETHARSERPGIDILRREIAQIEEDYADDEEYEEATHAAVQTSTRALPALSPRERWLLDQMQSWARQAKAQLDCKAKGLIDWLRPIVRPGGSWSDERLIIFTEYRATQKWLAELLVSEGLAGGERLMLLYGGMDDDQRESIKAAFQTNPRQSAVRILLATDAASEGIDLQNYCHRLLHVEIPWNPNRMEQRNGRIDRHGQRHDPLIYHFAGKGYGKRSTEALAVAPSDLEADLEFLMTAVRKVEQIRVDLGKVGPVIAAQVEEAMVGRRTRLDTIFAEEEAAALRNQLKFERELRRTIARHVEQLKETRQTLGLSPEAVQAAVATGLQLAGQPPLRPATVPGIWPDPERVTCPVFTLPALSGSWAACTEGLAHPHSGEIRPVVFDHDLARGRDDVVLAHLNHRLVQMALRLLRAELWTPHERRGLFRVTARRIPSHILDAPAVIAHGRVVIIGGDSRRLHEEVIAAGGELRQGRFRRLNVGQIELLLREASDKPVPAAVQERLAGLWPQIEPALSRSLEVRMQDLLTGMQSKLRQRADKEMRDIESVLAELANAISLELARTPYRQLELFSDNEISQLQLNSRALEARLQQIPAEIEQEKAAIRQSLR